MGLEIRHPYFLGIGGIGMSALAQHYLNAGCKVSGYDRVSTPLTRKLESMGAIIHYEEDPRQIPGDVDVVIYTPAIPSTHAEWKEIIERGLPVFKRAKILGEICKGYNTFAVAGTHGKTTTSALLAYLLKESIGCNAILGGVAVNFSGNYHFDSQSRIMVTEADEYDRSFHHLYPACSAVTAWDADHLDIYGNLENMREAYLQFIHQSEYCILNDRMPRRPVSDAVYGLGENLEERESEIAGNRCYATDIRVGNGRYFFDYVSPSVRISDLEFPCAGRHNIENAVAAIAMALKAGVSVEDIRKALPGFRGVHRRLEKVAGRGNVVYYDDYAHHPAEIEASLKALSEFYPGYRLAVMFQPHLYTRTRDLAEGFAKSLAQADKLCLVDIYPARELPIEGVDTRLIGSRIDRIQVDYASKEDLLLWVKQSVLPIDGPWVLVSMGAGNIDTMVRPLADLIMKGGDYEF